MKDFVSLFIATVIILKQINSTEILNATQARLQPVSSATLAKSIYSYGNQKVIQCQESRDSLKCVGA